MTPFSVNPSSLQVNEGDSFTTSLSGFTPGSTVYFRLPGSGVSKKDFAAGGVKGKVKVDANGNAIISTTLKADKKTEGSESLSIQVFSDRKMRNLLGQSDSVVIGDTSVKAQKKISGGGKGDQIGIIKDEITGLFLMSGYGKILSDKYYDESSEVVKRSGSSGLQGTEWEFSKNLMIITAKFLNSDGSQRYRRIAYAGDFTFQNNEVVAARINSTGVYTYDEFNGNRAEDVDTTNFIPPRNVEDIRISGKFEEAVSNDNVSRSLTAFRLGGQVINYVGDFNDIFSFAGGGVFQPSWWNDAFAPNLI